jgi:non-specific serine/threonine protein kinase
MPQMIWLNEMDQDYDNLRAALTWGFRSDLEIGLRLAVATCDYWIKRGRLTDGRYWLEKSLEVYNSANVSSPNLLMDILNCLALLAYFQDDLAAMHKHAEALLALGRKEQDTKSIKNALFYMGQDALQQRDYEGANIVFEEVLSLSRPMGISHHVASALLMQGLAAAGQKDYERALAFNTESLGLYCQLGDKWGESLILRNMAVIREEAGNYDEARALCRQSLRLSREINDKRTLSQSLEQMAGLMSLQGEHQLAARLMGAAGALRQSIFAAVEPLDRPHHYRWVEQVRANLDEATLAAAWAEGRAMTLEQAVAYALED